MKNSASLILMGISCFCFLGTFILAPEDFVIQSVGSFVIGVMLFIAVFFGTFSLISHDNKDKILFRETRGSKYLSSLILGLWFFVAAVFSIAAMTLLEGAIILVQSLLAGYYFFVLSSALFFSGKK